MRTNSVSKDEKTVHNGLCRPVILACMCASEREGERSEWKEKRNLVCVLRPSVSIRSSDASCRNNSVAKMHQRSSQRISSFYFGKHFERMQIRSTASGLTALLVKRLEYLRFFGMSFFGFWERSAISNIIFHAARVSPGIHGCQWYSTSHLRLTSLMVANSNNNK